MKTKIFKFNIIFLVSSLLLAFGCAKEDDSKTSTDNTTASSDNTTSVTSTNVVNPYVLFSSSYEKIDGSSSGVWWKSQEDGSIYTGESGNWAWETWDTDNDAIKARQSMGKIWNHTSALSDNDTIYITVKGPQNNGVNVSKSDQIVVQMGNLSSINYDGSPTNATNTHNVFTLGVKGGVQNSSDYSWSNDCRIDVTLDATSHTGINTYYLPFDNMTCISGNKSSLKDNVTEVSVLVVGGKNPNSDNTTTKNTTGPAIGFIAFTDSTDNQTMQIDNTSSPYVLFASQYEKVDGSSSGVWWKSKENGSIYTGETGNWAYASWDTDNAAIKQRQSMGKQWQHTSALANNDTIYLTVKAPSNKWVYAGVSEKLVIQMGNGAPSSNSNTHNIFSVSVKGGIQNTSDYSWSNSCSSDVTLDSTHTYGLQTYYVNFDNMTCSSGTMSSLKDNVSEVVVSVLGGKNPGKDNTTSSNLTLPSIGFIGFSK